MALSSSSGNSGLQDQTTALFLTTIPHTADEVLKINPSRVNLDPYAVKAVLETENYYSTKPYGNAKGELTKRGVLGKVASLTARFNESGLDEPLRVLLSRSTIYAELIWEALDKEKVKEDDLEGLYGSVLRNVANKPRSYFFARMLNHILNDKRISTQDGSHRWARLGHLTKAQGLPIAYGEPQLAVNKLLTIVYSEGDIPFYVESFAQRTDSGISQYAFTPSILQKMTDYLVKLGVKITNKADVDKGHYDEYFALAYSEALKARTVADDPIDIARIKGGEVTWNFRVDTFESTEAQGVISENILAAGALDYIYYIGERMQVFNVANALVLRWASGVLDVPSGPTAATLYRYHKLRSERSTPEERAMLYRRVLNRGGGRLLSGMIPNEDLPRLWHQLMSEVAEYIRKSEGSRYNESWVSRTPIYEATKNLQYNLSENMTGMSHLQVTEDYAHLQEALEIVKSPDVVATYGGRRKSVWTVIEQVSKEDMQLMVPTAPIRTSAVEGNKVYQWIANFNEGTVKDAEFKTMISAAEAWIIAQAAMEEDDGSFGREDDADIVEIDDDDFDDWDD